MLMKTLLQLELAIASLALATFQSMAALAPNATGRHLIAFAASSANSTGRPGGIYLMRDDNTAIRQLTGFSDSGTWSNNPRNPLPDDQPSISSDGKKIVFTSSRAGSFDIWVMDINGGHLKRLTTSSAREVDPVWSPDGQFIAYASDQGSSELKIWQMRADGSDKRQLTTGTQEDTDPAWYPTGGTIAFSRKVGLNDYDIFILRRGDPTSSGAVLLRLTARNGVDRFPVFSPSGTRLVYSSERAFDLQLPYGHIVSSVFSETTGLGAPINLTDDNQRLGDFRRGGAGPSFSPDGTKVVGFNSDGILLSSQQQLMRLTTTGASEPTAARLLPRFFDLCINPAYGPEIDSDGDGRPDYFENPNGLVQPTDFVSAGHSGNTPAFGSRVATPNLNHDDYADVAILGSTSTNGIEKDAVFLAAGTAFGLDVPSNPSARNTSTDLPAYVDAGTFAGIDSGDVESFNNIAAGDFNGDGFNDLAIVGARSTPVPGEVVHLLFGNVSSRMTVGGINGLFDFGAAVAVGDFDNDGRADLVVGIPDAQFPLSTRANVVGGLVQVYRGQLPGQSLRPENVLLQESTTLNDALIGTALAVGDFNGDGVDDLAVGAPRRTLEVVTNGVTTTLSGMGTVYVLFGSPQGGLQSGPALEILPSSVPSPAGGLIPLLRFGSALTAGDFDGDGRDDLVVGMPFALADTGVIAVYSGGLFPGGTVPTARVIACPTNIVGAAFGSAVQAGDFNGDTLDDLVVSAPGLDQIIRYFSTISSPTCVRCIRGLNAGLRQTLVSSNFDLNPAGSSLFPNLGVDSIVERFPSFVPDQHHVQDLSRLATFAVGSLDNSGPPELLIGVPRALAYPDPRVNSGTDLIRGVVCVSYGGQVGEFTLTPQKSFVRPGSPSTLQLVWRHPEQWRLVHDVHLRFVNETGVWAWVKFNEETRSISLYDEASGDFGVAVTVGDAQTLSGQIVQINVADAALVGSGSDGLEVTMTLPIEFTGVAAGQRLRVELFATDDRGRSQGWNPAGEVTVLRTPRQPWLEIEPHLEAPGQAWPTLKIHSLPGQRVQLEQSIDFVTWTTVQEIENTTGEVSVDVSTTHVPGSFYRVRSE
jgi:Tol biopolymer transport system component